MKTICFVAAAIIVAPSCIGTASAQSSASDFTSATRYDLAGRVTGAISPDPDGTGALHFAAIRNTYDVRGRAVTVETGELSTWQSEAVAPADWSGFTVFEKVETAYDGLDRKIKDTHSGWTTATGWVVNSITQYSYDAMGQLKCTASRMNPAAFTTLPDSACDLGTPGSYGPDRISRNYYDAVGRLLKVRIGYGTALEQDHANYGYSANGKRTSVIDANGNKATMTYDVFDRLARWYFPDKTTVGQVSTVDYEEYGYDAAANRTSVRKRDGRNFAYTYDNLNQLVVKDVPSGACSSPYICATPSTSAVRDVYYSYDARGRQTYARYDSTSGTDLVGTTYDAFGRVTSSITAMGGYTRTLSYQYDANGNRTRLTFPDSNYFVYSYDGIDRMSGISESGTTSIVSANYDAQGHLASVTRGTVTSTFAYDAGSQLASLGDNLDGTTSDLTSTFAYNPAGQITAKSRSNDAYAFGNYVSVSRSYSANGLNQYATVGAATFGYDSNGNLTSDGALTYTYDAENRLISTSAGSAAALVYDPLGRLFQVGVKQFLYDGDELVAEYTAGNPTTIYKRYIHGTGSDDPLIWYGGAGLGPTNRLSMQSDHQGSVVSIADSAGAQVALNAYDEYGIPGGGNAGRFQFTGQTWLPEIGMYYYKARIYSPTLGRFLQIDPVGYTEQFNLYGYVGNDPINGVDPTGLWEDTICRTGDNCTINGINPDELEMALANGMGDAFENAAEDIEGGASQGVFSNVCPEIYQCYNDFATEDMKAKLVGLFRNKTFLNTVTAAWKDAVLLGKEVAFGGIGYADFRLTTKLIYGSQTAIYPRQVRSIYDSGATIFFHTHQCWCGRAAMSLDDADTIKGYGFFGLVYSGPQGRGGNNGWYFYDGTFFRSEQGWRKWPPPR